MGGEGVQGGELGGGVEGEGGEFDGAVAVG